MGGAKKYPRNSMVSGVRGKTLNWVRSVAQKRSPSERNRSGRPLEGTSELSSRKSVYQHFWPRNREIPQFTGQFGGFMNPPDTASRHHRTTDLREAVRGILHVLRRDIPRRRLRHNLPPWGTKWWCWRYGFNLSEDICPKPSQVAQQAALQELKPNRQDRQEHRCRSSGRPSPRIPASPS